MSRGPDSLARARRVVLSNRLAMPLLSKRNERRERDSLRHGARKREGGRRALEVILGLLSGAVQAVVALGRGGDRPLPERGRWGAHVERDQEGDHPFLATTTRRIRRRALEVILGLLSGAVQAVVALGRGGDRPLPERGRWGAHVERDQEGDHPFLADDNTADQSLVALHSPVIGDRASVRNRSRDCEVAGARDASIRDILTVQRLGGPDRDVATRWFRGRATRGIG